MFLSRLFSRTSDDPAKDRTDEHRAEYRIRVPAGAPLQVTLRREDEPEFVPELLDMTIRGLCFGKSDDAPEDLAVDDVVEVVLSADSGALLRTPGMLRWRSEHEGEVRWGLEFINLGNLYGQWENFLGEFMNRRSQVRVPLGCDKPLRGQLTSCGFRLPVAVYDLTSKGIGLLVSHVEAAPLRMDEPARVTFKLPRAGEVSGTVILRSRRRVDTRDVLGAEFDFCDAEGFVRHRERIAAYCARREGELARWEGSWEVRVVDAA